MAAQASKPEIKPRKPRKDKKVNTQQAIKLKTENGLSYQQIAKIQGSTPAAVHRDISHLLPTESTEVFKSKRADILARLQERILTTIDDKDIQKAPLGSRVLAVAQMYDKERLERGQSTSNIASIHADIAALKGRPNVDKPVDNPSCQPLPAVHEVKS